MADTMFTLVAVPFRANLEQDRIKQCEHLKTSLGALGPAARAFNVPNLKVGTLDSLLEASDELNKLDPQLEGTCFKLANLLQEISGVEREKALELRGVTQDGKSDVYLKEWSWTSSTYNPKDSISDLLQKFQQVAAGADERTRPALQEYLELNKKLESVKKRSQGSLANRPISEAVKKWCHGNTMETPTESDFLTTLFVAVPKAQQEEWLAKYPKFHDFVVPRSSSVVASDDEYILNSIVCFKRVVDDVKNGCRKAKFIVRELTSAEELSVAEFHSLEKKNNEDKTKLKLLLAQQYTACFVAWIHLKCVRLFVESLLRYGLPPRFVPVLIAASSHQEETIREKLAALYSDYANKFQHADDTMVHDTGALHHEYPFVCLKVANILQAR